MSRAILDEQHIHPAIRQCVAGSPADIVKGMLIGGADDPAPPMSSGELKRMLA